MEFFDNHAHLDDERFDTDREEIIKQICNSGIAGFISAGYSLEGTKKALELAHKYSFIYTTAGISPNDIPQSEEELWKNIQEIDDIINKEVNFKKIKEEEKELSKLKQAIKDVEKLKIKQKNNISKDSSKIVAVGEIGLDYYWEKDDKMRELQQKAFIKQIEIANKYKLPIVIHTRDAIMDTLKILKEHEVLKKGVFHCCPQNRELIKEALKLGYYISFAGPITFKNSKNADEMINLVPNDRLLIETDSPYLAPEPVRGTRNTPINVKYIAQKIAKVKNISIEEVANLTRNNVLKIYGI